MSERPNKRTSRSITFYPTPEDQHLLEELDRLAELRQMPFSDLCKQLCQAALATAPTTPYTVQFTAAEKAWEQRLATELATQGLSFSEWVKQRLQAPSPAAPADLETRLQRLEQVVAELQRQPPPLSRAEIEHLIQQYLAPSPPAPPPSSPTADPLLAELGALLREDF